MNSTIQKTAPFIAAGAITLSVLVLLGSTAAYLFRSSAAKSAVVESPKEQQQPEVKRPEGISIIYQDSSKPHLKLLLQESGILEHAATVLGNSLKVAPFTIEAKDCGYSNASFQHSSLTGQSVTVCYEYLSEMVNLFQSDGLSVEDASQVALYSVLQTVYHEFGHLVAFQFQLPTTGSDENVADDFSVFFALNQPSPQVKAVQSFIYGFALQKDLVNPKLLNSDHSLNGQRFYRNACLLYGSNPAKYESFVAQLGFSGDRLKVCERNYSTLVNSWNTLLKSYTK